MLNLVTVVGENTHILPHMLKHYENIVDKVYVAVYRQSDNDTILKEIEDLGIEPYMVFTENKYNWRRNYFFSICFCFNNGRREF